MKKKSSPSKKWGTFFPLISSLLGTLVGGFLTFFIQSQSMHANLIKEDIKTAFQVLPPMFQNINTQLGKMEEASFDLGFSLEDKTRIDNNLKAWFKIYKIIELEFERLNLFSSSYEINGTEQDIQASLEHLKLLKSEIKMAVRKKQEASSIIGPTTHFLKSVRLNLLPKIRNQFLKSIKNKRSSLGINLKIQSIL